MKLSITKRATTRKSETLNVRRVGNVPAIIYGNGAEPEQVIVNGPEFAALLRTVQQGRLSTTQIELAYEGKTFKALIKDIQYHPTSYIPTHIDLMKLEDSLKVRVKVPMEYVGAAECPGIKLGGFLRSVLRVVPVECDSPKLIPSHFELSVAELGMRQSKRVKDIKFPNGVRPLAPVEEVAVVIAKR